MSDRKNCKETGRKSEDIVASFLETEGYTILERNWFCRTGEIDIIAEKQNTVCAVEVKTVPPSWDEGEIQFKVNNAKMFRIKRAMALFLSMKSCRKYDEVRFDVAAVCNGKISYWKGAFDE